MTLCKPTAKKICSCARVFCCGCKQHRRALRLPIRSPYSNISPLTLQMATRLQIIRTSWLSRHLCRSSTVSPVQIISNINSPRNMSSMGASGKCLQMENINPCIKTMEYAVRYGSGWSHDWIGDNFLIKHHCRGPLVIRAAAIEKELEQVNERTWKQRNFVQLAENFLRKKKSRFHDREYTKRCFFCTTQEARVIVNQEAISRRSTSKNTRFSSRSVFNSIKSRKSCRSFPSDYII